MQPPPVPKSIQVAIAIIAHNQRILICRRPDDTVLGGLWEFPGGKVETGESVEHCLLREVREELGIDVAIDHPLPTIDHRYPHAHVRLHPFLCHLSAGEARPLGCAKLKWIDPEELAAHPFPPANAPLLHQLASLFHAPAPPEPDSNTRL